MQFLKYRLNQYLIIITSFVAINSSIATLLKVLFILINFIFFINWYSKNKNDFFIKLLKLLLFASIFNCVVFTFYRAELSFGSSEFFSLFSTSTSELSLSSFYYNTTRNFIVEIFFTASVLALMLFHSPNFILGVLFRVILICLIFVVIELILGYNPIQETVVAKLDELNNDQDLTQRLSMIFREPMSAGYFYVFIFFIIVNYFKGLKKKIGYLFLIIGLGISSKAQYLSFLLYSFIRLNFKKLLVFLFLFSLFLIYMQENIYVENSLMFISSVYENGFDFIYEQIGGDTYYVRFYGIALSILGFFEYPLGVGYGGHVYIFETILSNIFFDAEMPHEIKTYLDSYITLLSPKSNFFLFLISFGIFFLIFIYKLSRFFFKTRKLNNSLYNAFIITLIMSLFAEMNPMLLYFAILYGLQQNTNFKTHKNISHQFNNN